MSRVSRWAMLAVLALAAVGVAGWMSHGATGRVRLASRSGTLSSCPRDVRRLGLIAFVTRGRLELIDLASCRLNVLRRANPTDLRFSPDGRWLAYSSLVNGNPTPPVVVPADGGPARRPLGSRVLAWTWTPQGAVLYGITGTGSLVSATPHGPLRVVAAHATTIHFGYYGAPLALSPDGQRAAVDRSSCPTGVGELDTVNVRTGARAVAIRQKGAFLTFAGWSPDGRWLLFWRATMCSGSLAADGWPLEAVPAAGGSPVRVVPTMLLYQDFLTWCGSRLIAAAGPSRQTNLRSKLLIAALPTWSRRTLEPADRLSWVSPSCAPGGRLLAAAAGPSSESAQFGAENRSIWLLHPSGRAARRLTPPPASDLSDEAPRFSRDGRWILYVRSRLVPVDTSRDTIELARTSGAGGEVPIIDFTSQDFSYYDHFSWPSEIAWTAQAAATSAPGS